MTSALNGSGYKNLGKWVALDRQIVPLLPLGVPEVARRLGIGETTVRRHKRVSEKTRADRYALLESGLCLKGKHPLPLDGRCDLCYQEKKRKADRLRRARRTAAIKQAKQIVEAAKNTPVVLKPVLGLSDLHTMFKKFPNVPLSKMAQMTGIGPDVLLMVQKDMRTKGL